MISTKKAVLLAVITLAVPAMIWLGLAKFEEEKNRLHTLIDGFRVGDVLWADVESVAILSFDPETGELLPGRARSDKPRRVLDKQAAAKLIGAIREHSVDGWTAEAPSRDYDVVVEVLLRRGDWYYLFIHLVPDGNAMLARFEATSRNEVLTGRRRRYENVLLADLLRK